MTSTASTVDVHPLLAENGTNRYYIEYGFRSNHLAHGVIALARLGAGKQRIQRFIDWYTPKLESATLKLQAENMLMIQSVNEETKGTRTLYYRALDHYTKRLKDKYNGELALLVRNEFPNLTLGMVGSALHGLIHVGYGYAANSQNVVCEGLAYLHYTSMPLRVSDPASLKCHVTGDAKECCSVVEVLNSIRQDHELIKFMKTESTNPENVELMRLAGGIFQRSVGALFTFKADQLVDYSKKITLPDIDENLGVAEMGKKLGKWLIDASLWLYLASDKTNDFFLIHGVTSSWSLYHILQQLGAVEDVRLATAVHLCILLATYLAQGSPPLKVERVPTEPNESFMWSELIMKTLDEDRDEHIYKIIQVCHDMDDGKCAPAQSALYREAAKTALENTLQF